MTAKAGRDRAEYDPATNTDVAPGWADFPIETFVAEGLLYEANRQWFWPKGLALTAAAWSRFDELAVEYRPRVERALNATVANLPGAAEVTPAIVDAFLAIMLEDLAGKMRHGLRLQEPIPPEVIESGRSRSERIAVEMRAAQWITDRLASLEP